MQVGVGVQAVLFENNEGETLEQAVPRKVFEEVGLTVNPNRSKSLMVVNQVVAVLAVSTKQTQNFLAPTSIN